MNYVNELLAKFFNVIQPFIAYNTSHFSFLDLKGVESYFRFSIASYNYILLVFIFLIVLNVIYDKCLQDINYIQSIVKIINNTLMFSTICVILLKFKMSLGFESDVGIIISEQKLHFYEINNNYQFIQIFTPLTTTLSDAILLLSIIVGMSCLMLLGSKRIIKSLHNVNIFCLFNIFVTIMVSTNNLLIMYLCFEFIFLPTVYCAFTFGYSKKSDKASKILFN